MGTLEGLREAAKDRGRDGGRLERFELDNRLRFGAEVFLGNWRATPTPELEDGDLQPYDGLVHNGTIANDKELGIQPGEIDSQVLARILNRSSLTAFAESLQRVKGSYAIAAVSKETVFLATNYKPIHYWADGDRAVYFSSLERHFEGVLPFGQRPVELPPYSAIDLLSKEGVALPREDGGSTLVVASAGLDSTVVANHLSLKGRQVRLLHFRYGCRAETREAERIPRIAEAIGVDHAFVDLPYHFAKESPLLQEGSEIAGGVEGAEFAHEWVPARNLVLLSMATAYAEALGFHRIALGNNLEEAGAYPDNEEQFTLHFDRLLPYAVQNGYRVQLEAPVAHLMKHEIVALGAREQAPLGDTWSCYRGGERHCGECGPCFMRREAFRRNDLEDPVFE